MLLTQFGQQSGCMAFLVSDAPSGRWRTAVSRVAESLATPLVADDYLDLFAPLRRGATLRARVVAVRPETRDAATPRMTSSENEATATRKWTDFSQAMPTTARAPTTPVVPKAWPLGNENDSGAAMR